ncbi:DUF192 domain-containing protein [Ruficoccus sp. ZRK36]|uniref:DUF192 domain-containing protein n=1 Tax=Ruficoccus sp. ZRK36 TaxID=2866311 RepID=UPI001C735716|nr:DUF192 domain-containing protein [Ruficoccus sp. ZRK36]QYY35975.1 DUF192 domain-containing protein [Ruficoccus sp. ZRK36]
MKNLLPILLIVLAALTLGACQEDTTQPSANLSQPSPVSTWYPLTLDDQIIQAQFAVDRREQSHGLMDRDSLGQNNGMLFVFPETQRMSFWMRRTRIPLDIGYFTPDGVLREVYQMQPYDETAVPSIRSDLQFALEMNQGWFAAHGVKPGDKLDMNQVKEALRDRGYTPAKLGL